MPKISKPDGSHRDVLERAEDWLCRQTQPPTPWSSNTSNLVALWLLVRSLTAEIHRLRGTESKFDDFRDSKPSEMD